MGELLRLTHRADLDARNGVRSEYWNKVDHDEIRGVFTTVFEYDKTVAHSEYYVSGGFRGCIYVSAYPIKPRLVRASTVNGFRTRLSRKGIIKKLIQQPDPTTFYYHHGKTSESRITRYRWFEIDPNDEEVPYAGDYDQNLIRVNQTVNEEGGTKHAQNAIAFIDDIVTDLVELRTFLETVDVSKLDARWIDELARLSPVFDQVRIKALIEAKGEPLPKYWWVRSRQDKKSSS